MKNPGYIKEEIKLFKKLNTPSKIQDFLNAIPFNFEEKGETCFSPREVIKNKKAHCMEGAIFASAVLEFHGYKPLIVDLRATHKPYDFDHVIAVFKKDGFWGAISKTNHAVLRYREPVYKNIRELVMSFFHEYFLNDGRKTLREYSEPFSLNYFNPSTRAKLGTGQAKENWRTTSKHLFKIPVYLDKIKHYKILTSKQIKSLRKADKVEIKAGEIIEYKKS